MKNQKGKIQEHIRENDSERSSIIVAPILRENSSRLVQGILEKAQLPDERKALNADSSIPVALKMSQSEELSGGEKDEIFIPVPKNLGDTAPSWIGSIRSRLTTASLEKTGLQLTIWGVMTISALAVVDLDIGLLQYLKRFQESSALQYGLKWDGWLIGHTSLRTIFLSLSGLFVVAGGSALLALRHYCSLEIGKHSMVIADYSAKTLHFHLVRNIPELEEVWYFGVLGELKKIISELVDELYDSTKIEELDTLVIDSYLLMPDVVFKKLGRTVASLLPYAEITEIPAREQEGKIKWGLEVLSIKKQWIRSVKEADTFVKRILLPIVCSEGFSMVSTIAATIRLELGKSEILRWIASPFSGKNEDSNSEKKEFSHTRGLSIRLPKNRPDALSEK